MFRLRNALALLALVVASAPASAATIVIDNYTTAISGADAVAPGVLTATGNLKTSLGNLGAHLGTRTVSLSENNGISATTQITGNFLLGMATGSGTTSATTTLLYNAFGNLNLTANNGISLNVSILDPGSPVTNPSVTATLTDNGGDRVLGPIFFNSTGTLFIPFGAVDRDVVSAIKLVFNLQNGTDVTIDGKNGVIITETPTPEPMTLAAFGVMTLVGGVYGRRKLKARAVAQA
jgi:hypothetical protein